MTEHPCKGMTKAQQRDFELIAINQRPRGTPKTTDALKKRGLITEHIETHHDRFGVFYVPNWQVPLPIHCQWCKWASEQECGND